MLMLTTTLNISNKSRVEVDYHINSQYFCMQDFFLLFKFPKKKKKDY